MFDWFNQKRHCSLNLIDRGPTDLSIVHGVDHLFSVQIPELDLMIMMDRTSSGWVCIDANKDYNPGWILQFGAFVEANKVRKD